MRLDRTRRVGRCIATGSVLLAALGLTTAPSAAATATATAHDVAAKAFSLLDFGCANPANHHSLDKLLPARRGPIGAGATCYGKVLVPAGDAGPAATTGPTGLGPSDIRSAYRLTGLSSGGATVAVVDAYDDPNAESDLATYRAQFGLAACTTGNGCFRKVNQAGAQSPLPTADAGWSEEISLDLDAISAACPDCKILLVEANSPNTDDLMSAVDTAARLGATAISNSYGGAEDSTILAADPHLDHPGVAITASSGDSGYGVSWPASSPYVTAVGGTTLTRAAGTARGWTETAWSKAGSGCSAFEPKPAWQHDTGCARRTVADVAADADPTSGLAVYDTYNTCQFSGTLGFLCPVLESLGLVQGADGWIQVGGTSLASPLIASVYALAVGANGAAPAASSLYADPGALNDVTSGSNGSCAGSYLCTAGTGYDGPTGLGTPNGVAAFAPAAP